MQHESTQEDPGDGSELLGVLLVSKSREHLQHLLLRLNSFQKLL